MNKRQLIRSLAAGAIFTTGTLAGYGLSPRYQTGYDQALDDIAAGEVVIESQFTRARQARTDEFTREAEYIRVVSAIAEAYRKDPSEIEVECGLVDERREVRRVTEDDPEWDCRTMGNKICGPEVKQ